MSDGVKEPDGSPFLREEFLWVREDPRRRVMAMFCRLPTCRARVTRKSGGRVALFCSAEHSRLYVKRRNEVAALVAELGIQLAPHLPATGRPSTRAGRRILSDFYYAHYLLMAYPDLDLPPLPRPGKAVVDAQAPTVP